MITAKRDDPFPLLLFSKEERMEAGLSKAGMRRHSEGEPSGFWQKAFPPEQGVTAEKNEYPIRAEKIYVPTPWGIDAQLKGGKR